MIAFAVVLFAFTMYDYVHSTIMTHYLKSEKSYKNDADRALMSKIMYSKVHCAKLCSEEPECKKFLFCSPFFNCSLYRNTRDCASSNPLEPCTCFKKPLYGNCSDYPCLDTELCVDKNQGYTCVMPNHTVIEVNDTAMVGQVFDTIAATNVSECITACYLRSACLSFNFIMTNSTCELNTKTMITDSSSYIGNHPGSYYSNINIHNPHNLDACSGYPCSKHHICEPDTVMCTIHYFDIPDNPYVYSNVIPEFDQSISLRRIGTNLKYRCNTSYFPVSDWTFAANGTWIYPECKALGNCYELLTMCNSAYANESYVFKYPGSGFFANLAIIESINGWNLHRATFESDYIVDCYKGVKLAYLRTRPNSSYSYFSTNLTNSACYANGGYCGTRLYPSIRLFIYNIPKIIAAGEKKTSYTDCNGLMLFDSGNNCSPGCYGPRSGYFVVDVRETGLKHSHHNVTDGNIIFSNNDQVVRCECNGCSKRCYIVSYRELLVADGTDINYEGAIIPQCLSRF